MGNNKEGRFLCFFGGGGVLFRILAIEVSFSGPSF